MKGIFLWVPVLAFLAAGCTNDSASKSTDLKAEEVNEWAPLGRYVQERLSEADMISEARKGELNALAQFVSATSDTGEVKLVFICTHNSRRSHFGQVWAQLAAHHFGLDSTVSSFSGGTESTAINERAVGALRRAGMDVHPAQLSDNPKYAVHYASDRKPLVCFSKKYDNHSENPSAGFAAVMTCSDADKQCPLVSGAVARFSLPYLDPKVSDGTDEELATYDERCAQIAREMLFVMEQASRS